MPITDPVLWQNAAYATNPEAQRRDPLNCANIFKTLVANSSNQEESSYWLGKEVYCWALAGQQHLLTVTARHFVDANVQTAKEHATNLVMQRENPLYCEALCRRLAQCITQPEESTYWTGISAYCLGLANDQYRLTLVAHRFVTADLETAKQHAKDGEFQRTNPLYCAMLCRIIGQGNFNSKERAYWVGLEAYCWVLAKNQDELTRTVFRFVAADPETAKQHAINREMLRENPLYCEALGKALLQKNPNLEDHIRWIKIKAYCFGLAKDHISLTPSVRGLVHCDPITAQQDATNREIQRENPLYCAALCAILAEKASGFGEFSHLKGVEAYCLTLLDGKESTDRSKACANLFVEGDLSTAERHARDEVMQQEHPLYCAVLFQALANKTSDRLWKKELLLKSAELSLLACNIEEFRHSLHLISAQNLSGPKDLNVWHFLMRFLATHYTHASNVLIVDHLVEKALKELRIIVEWARPFICEKNIWNGFSLLMDTLYYHWEELSKEARGHILSRLALLIPQCTSRVWTVGVCCEEKLLDTPLRLLRLLLSKAPEDPALIELVRLAIKHAPREAWSQAVVPEEGSVYMLFTDLKGSLQQAFHQRFPVSTTQLAPHSVFFPPFFLPFSNGNIMPGLFSHQ